MTPDTIPTPCTAAAFKAAALYLNEGKEYGAYAHMQRILGTSYTCVNNYAHGRRPIPETVARLLRLTIAEKNRREMLC